MSVTAVIKHRVRDYDAWREAYDDFADAQREGGVTHASVHRASDDPNQVLVVHGFESEDDAQTFLGGDALRRRMQEAGVEGRPQIEIYRDA